MFLANVLTVWVEALQQAFANPDYTEPNEGMVRMKDIPVSTDYPQEEINYPGIWVNYSMQGDVKNVGIGHIEYSEAEDGIEPVYRWQFGGFVEITIGALGNLERALLVDEVLRMVAVARVGENSEGALREHIQNSDLIGQNVTWESITLSGFGEAQGTPWGTDDVLYEATLTLVTQGEVVLSPRTGLLVPLSEVRIIPVHPGEGDEVPVIGTDGWH